MELKKYSYRGQVFTNEWRLLFLFGQCVSMDSNSYLPSCYPSPPFIPNAAANTIDSPYFTMDMAEKTNGEWIVIELGDGGVSGIATSQTMESYDETLFSSFTSLTSPCSSNPLTERTNLRSTF